MAKKKKMTVTSRFFAEQKPLSTHEIQCPAPRVSRPGNPRVRLSFVSGYEKQSFTVAQLAEAINNASKQAIFVLDTSFFMSAVDEQVWDALLRKHILITPGVWNELQTWRNDPRQNRHLRDLLLLAERQQTDGTQYVNELLFPVPKGLGTPCYLKMEILTAVDESYKAHAYHYYFNLLAVRKWMGPITEMRLQNRFGRPATEEEFLTEVQGKYGKRAFLLARKGCEKASSPNLLTDEQLVVMAVQTAIIRGSEIVILTRDADIQEQYFKVLTHMKEHYRCMLAAEKYAANRAWMACKAKPREIEPFFAGDSILMVETTEDEFDVLPKKFHPIDICCTLVGGETNDLRVTINAFRSETEMASMLRMKKRTGGLNTDRFQGKNCYIQTTPLMPGQHRITVFIGKEKRIKLGPLECSVADAENTLFSRELLTQWRFRAV